MAEVHGTCEPRFEPVRATLADQIDTGADLGASVAVFLHGEPVVDIWGGWADAEKTRPWERDTITNVWSTTKTMTFLVALMLHDRKELDFHAPVATYWPEFAANGKERIEVRHVMGHTAGLSGWEEPLAAEDLANWELCIDPAGRPGAVVGARHRLGVPRADAGLPHRRDRPPHHRREHRRLVRPRGGQAARCGLPHRPPGERGPPRVQRHPAAADRPRRHGGPGLRAHAQDVHEPAHRRHQRAPGMVAARRDPRRQRPGQCPLGGRHPVDHRRTGRGPRRAPALGRGHRPDLRGTGGGHRQGARRAASAWAWATA